MYSCVSAAQILLTSEAKQSYRYMFLSLYLLGRLSVLLFLVYVLSYISFILTVLTCLCGVVNKYY